MADVPKFLKAARSIGRAYGAITDAGKFCISVRDLAGHLELHQESPNANGSVQMVMSVSSDGPTLRDEIFGWTTEDPSLYARGKMIGHTPSARESTPKTIMEALANGWRLLGPPVMVNDNTTRYWDWWLVKEKEL